METNRLLINASSYPEVSYSSGSDIRAPLIMKLKGIFNGTRAQDNQYDGQITDVANDGSEDYKGRPADKATFGRWKAVMFIMVAVILERLAYYGIATNLVSYLTTELHEGSAQSVTNVWYWGGVAWIVPLFGGFIADTYLGRYRTIIYSMVIYLTGMVLLTLSVSIRILRPPECPTQQNGKNASTFQIGFFYFALYLIAIGVGGVKPCFSSLGADQFDEEDERERPMKRSFFNYWWVSVTSGALLALTVLVYIEDRVGYGWGYGIPTVGLFIATAILLLGHRTYRYKRPMGSPLTQVAYVIVAAFRNSNIRVPVDPNELHEVVQKEKRNLRHTNHLRFLDKAAMPIGTGPTIGQNTLYNTKDTAPAALSNWKLCTITQVEEVKLLARVMPVWFTTLVFLVIVQQLSTIFLRQGMTLDLSMGPHFNIPPASLELSSAVTALTLIPLYDTYLVPFVRRYTGNERGFSLLQRMGIGLVISILGMSVAAIVEMKRLKIIRDNGLELSEVPLPMSIFWLIPQYSIIAAAEVFTYMGQLEFFYDQVPDSMQTIGTALFTSNTGFAHFLCSWILSIVTIMTGRDGRQAWIVNNINESRLDKYYWMLTSLSAVNFVAYFAVSMWYTYKTVEVHKDHKRVVIIEPPIVE